MFRGVAMVWLSVCSVFACAQSPADVSSRTEPLRVILQFNKPGPYSDAAFMKELQTHSHAQVRYIAAVSGDTHVYSVQPDAGQSQTLVLQRLGRLPMVTHVEVDQQATAQ
jgi:hypothetical protein